MMNSMSLQENSLKYDNFNVLLFKSYLFNDL